MLVIFSQHHAKHLTIKLENNYIQKYLPVTHHLEKLLVATVEIFSCSKFSISREVHHNRQRCTHNGFPSNIGSQHTIQLSSTQAKLTYRFVMELAFNRTSSSIQTLQKL